VEPSRAASEAPPPFAMRPPPGGPAPSPPEEEVEQERAMRPLRVGLAALWVILAVAGTLWQRCQGGP
jgi:hypothetical protein